MAQCDDGLSRQQEVFAAASRPFDTMCRYPFHLVAGKAKRVVLLTVTELQQLGDQRLRQSLIPKLIQLVPAVAIYPLLLITL